MNNRADPTRWRGRWGPGPGVCSSGWACRWPGPRLRRVLGAVLGGVEHRAVGDLNGLGRGGGDGIVIPDVAAVDPVADADGIGVELKESITEPGNWSMGWGSWGEHLPYYENKVTLDKNKKDKWGLAALNIDCEFKENEMKMRVDMKNSAAEMLEAAGMKNVSILDYRNPPGSAVHEMGTARMGRDPKTSVLNGNNQVWDAMNVFVTDGACMTSAACINPSLTYMAITARAADYAVSELKKNNL